MCVGIRFQHVGLQSVSLFFEKPRARACVCATVRLDHDGCVLGSEELTVT